MPSETYKIEDLIKIGKNVDLTHYKSSIHDKIYDISYTVTNVMYDYIKELSDMAIEVTLTEDEYHTHLYNPKSLAYKLYGTTDLYFIILMLNDLSTYKKFDLRKVKVLHPTNIDVLYEILDTERNYLRRSNVRISSPDNKIYSVDKYGEDNDEIFKIIEGLQQQIDSIKGTIMDAIESIIGEDLDKIIENIVNVEMDVIKNSIEMIINGKIENISNKIRELEKSIENIRNLVETIVNGKLDERLESIIKRLEKLEKGSGSDFKDIIDAIKDDLDKLLPNLEILISDRFKELLEKLDTELEMAGGVQTRDIGFSILPPLALGVQEETEMLIPYIGTIINGTISTPITDKKESNLIVVLHTWNKREERWDEGFKFNLHRDKYIDRFIMNVPIEDQPIRLSIESGTLSSMNGLQIVLSILEKPGSNRKEGVVEPVNIIKNGIRLVKIPLDKNNYKGMIDLAEKIQPSPDPAKYFIEIDGKIYSVQNNSLISIDEYTKANFNKFGANSIKDFNQELLYNTPEYKEKYEFEEGTIYITDIKGGE